MKAQRQVVFIHFFCKLSYRVAVLEAGADCSIGVKVLINISTFERNIKKLSLSDSAVLGLKNFKLTHSLLGIWIQNSEPLPGSETYLS